ncbi:Ig-like domain-containing protein [Nesterenkonia sp. Act20]|uniref:Ig-like domain-containing protein n=1 Tax=Nesterenkonia sp. Act20 TaxID=1483432 RepID=UPI001C44081B|nr:Ig-like domain-containing protein [Nesterenkonia sp. Act20]
MLQRVLLVLVALAATLLTQMPVAFSTAAFTSSSSTGESTIQAAADWTPPEVTVTDLGSSVRESVTVSAEASDADSELRHVSIQHRGSEATGWTELCTDTSAPFSCDWNTQDSDDGAHSLRALATDAFGNTATSETVTTAVANELTVVLADPGTMIRGAATLNTMLHNAGSTPYRVSVQFTPAGTEQWTTACAELTSPFTCSGNTSAMPDGEYDIRASATAGHTTTHSEVLHKIRVDNTAPSVTMTDPGSTLRGKQTFTSTAADGGSGLAEVTMQFSSAGSGTWSELCTDAEAPYSCDYDTTRLTDGSYSFRSVATDQAGNTTTSATVSDRMIQNTVSKVSMKNPGSPLTGQVTLSAAASSTAGVRSVKIQFAPSGSDTWTTVCAATTSPYSCSGDSNAQPNGSYSLRAVLTDGTGKETVSELITGVRVSNISIAAEAIAVHNGRTPGKVDSGDFINYVYSNRVDLDSISPGLSDGPRRVLLPLQDNSSRDTIDVVQWDGRPVNLGVVDLNRDYIDWRRTAVFEATMTPSISSYNGRDRTLINVSVGRQIQGGDVLVTNTGSWGSWGTGGYSNMTWTPSGSASSASGTPVSTTPITVRNRF